jgi:hypothetical protein
VFSQKKLKRPKGGGKNSKLLDVRKITQRERRCNRIKIRRVFIVENIVGTIME